MSNGKRNGCKDIWNAFMCHGATYTKNDIPFCPTTAHELPAEMILWDEAKHLYKRNIGAGRHDFHHDSYVCFFQDDYKFDGPKGIWNNPDSALKILCHFSGVITPDFSTYQDFPYPLKLYNTYRMRAFGYWLGKNGIPVYNSIRWGTRETWSFCWDGIPHESVVAIGTVGGSPRKLIDRRRFEEGLEELARVLRPHTILVYGSASYTCFAKLSEKGIRIVSYQSRTAKAFERGQAE